MKPTIIDVRTPGEFMDGNINGSINIPLQELPKRLKTISAYPQPLIVCCASGIRSAQAKVILNQNKISCENGGSWLQVKIQIHSK